MLSVLSAILNGLAVFLALELHYKIVKIREINNGKVAVKELVKPLTKLLEDQKTEFLPPMNDEEYEQHMLDESGRGELLKRVLNPFKWKSKGKNSQSSDS